MADDGTAVAKQQDGQDGPDGGVLRRLLAARSQAASGAGRAPQLPQPAAPTASRAAATAIGRAADRLYHLGVQPISVTPGALTLAELPELLPAPALLAILQGPGDLVGAMALCPETVTALIEVQTLGRITARTAEPRRPTRSDAMMCADFINALMAELATEMLDVEGFAGIKGYRYASYLDDPRPLSLMLEDKPYRSITFNVRLGGAETRDTTIFLALPTRGEGKQKPAPSVPASSVVAAGEDPQAKSRTAAGPGSAGAKPVGAPAASTLQAHVADAPVEMVGVLCRRRMTLGELRGLGEGKLLHLPKVSLTQSRLETRDGQLLAVGKFGEAEGCHAIRLSDPGAIAEAPLSEPAPQEGRNEPPIADLNGPDPFRRDVATDKMPAREVAPDAASAPSKAVGGA
ncbi:FliM/FliN family flagellar motor switch protein [Paracoccus salsus]|uniref:FliM/FliN family flagellar motor switch protein n=1 Tax=Paracoccus salsus TaxID=2911061 RepID=UPI001F31F4B1|nr:FliM/FliN family flagellar motor switch protein [Paracoccus salsus]MCF3972747.1 FliM/FliN family flagellar motor switch protein [Paracoccus salsus]